MDTLVKKVREVNGSDLILSVGIAPYAKVRGKMQPISDDIIEADEMDRLLTLLLDDEDLLSFQKNRILDRCLNFKDAGSVRFNFYYQQGHPALVGRLINDMPPSIHELGLPPAILPLFNQRNGLILVTGPAGSGKSTTLAAAIDHFNQTRHYHILSIEDPIEYRHKHNLSVIEQIEIGYDAHTFEDALRASLRQAPDVIVIGELRDRTSMEIAMTLAETGHLVMATVHARDSIQAVSRIVDTFPADQQNQICFVLSQVLSGVIAQQLIPDTENNEMVLAVELLLACPAVRNLIRERKTDQMYSVLQSGKMEGMITMNDSLARLIQQGIIRTEDALTRAARPGELTRLLHHKH